MLLLVIALVSIIVPKNAIADTEKTTKDQEQIEYEQRKSLTYKKMLNGFYQQQTQHLNDFQNLIIKNQQLIDELSSSSGDEQTKQIYTSLQKKWPDIVIAWSQISALPIEPLMHENRLLKIESFPLRKGFVAKKIETILASEDDISTLINNNNMANQSVVLQGLPALEYLLFNNKLLESEQENQTRIANVNYLLATINNNIAAIITEVIKDTNDLAINISNDFEENLVHLDNTINRLNAALTETIRKRFVLEELTNKEKIENLSWYSSNQHLTYLLARTDQIMSYLYLPELDENNFQYTVADLLLDIRYRGVSLLLQKKVETIHASIAMLNSNKAELKIDNSANEINMEQYASLHQQLKELQEYLTTAVFASVDISRDFNSTDGD